MKEKKLDQLVNKRESLIIRSPIDGVITRITNSKIGDEIRENNIIAVVDGTDQIAIHASVGETLDKYFLGMNGLITHKGKEFPAVVTKIDKDNIEGDAKSAQVFIEFKEELPEEFEIDQVLYFKVFGDKKENVLRIPSESLHDAFEYKYVFVLENGMKVKKNIKVGIVTDEYIEIISGLNENEEVILN